MEFIIITGMSGAGKSQAVGALEDIGYFCVDNVPPHLLTKLAELPVQSGGCMQKVAVVMDVRSRDMFADFESSLDALKENQCPFQVLFLDSSDEVLLRRYKETRRKHPLLEDESMDLAAAIREERRILSKARERADFVVDSSLLSTAKLKERIRSLLMQETNQAMVITCMSFGFKHGTPSDADLMFDLRCLPNPFYIPELREQTGLDQAVEDYVLQFKEAKGLIPRILDLIDYLLPLYQEEGKSQLVVAIGCTGGKHRSVVFTQLLAKHLTDKGCPVVITHRDIQRKNQ
ncbi:RNase adapter RapZ [Oscillospiraceae bacterium MB08-C2-2]|nr:RNase adapter RapZ [Oscillospiraceae bacterium MB08-C2-2]